MLFSPELSGKEQLQQLLVLRLFYLLSEAIVVAFLQFQSVNESAMWSAVPWHYLWMVVILHTLVVFGYFFHGRKQPEVSEFYLFQTILADILLFSGLLYFSGGATNGAVSILLLPVATAAALFRWHFSLLLALVAIGSYSVLNWFYWPVEASGHEHHHMGHSTQSAGFSSHLLAMWATFIFSCLLLIWFIGSQSAAVRAKQKSLAQLRESQLRDEQLIAIATFAANAAHDLATPLSSISLLCDELKHDEGKEGIDTLINQVNLCRDIVQSISHQAILNKSKINVEVGISEFFAGMIERWLVTRPDIVLSQTIEAKLDLETFTPDNSLESALTNILDNAAQASLNNGANQMSLSVKSENNLIEIEIIDFGSGIAADIVDAIGKEPVTSKTQGMGLGQFLANSTVQRSGGQVWRQSSEEGTKTVITLPISKENIK